MASTTEHVEAALVRRPGSCTTACRFVDGLPSRARQGDLGRQEAVRTDHCHGPNETDVS